MLPTVFILKESHLKLRLKRIQSKLIIAMGFSNKSLTTNKKYFENFETVSFANFKVSFYTY